MLSLTCNCHSIVELSKLCSNKACWKFQFMPKTCCFWGQLCWKSRHLCRKMTTLCWISGHLCWLWWGDLGPNGVRHRTILALWGRKKGHIAHFIMCRLMRLPAFYNWHKHLHCVLTSLGSSVCLAHHLNLLLLHTILAHLRILANAHLVTGTLLRSTITDMARYNVELLYHDTAKIRDRNENVRWPDTGVIGTWDT